MQKPGPTAQVTIRPSCLLSRNAAKYSPPRFNSSRPCRSFRASICFGDFCLGRCPRLLHFAPSALWAPRRDVLELRNSTTQPLEHQARLAQRHSQHFQYRRINLEHIVSKGLKMKTNRRLHVGERFFIAITFAHNDAFEAERISDVSVRVLLNNNLLGLHGCLLEANTSTNTSFCSLKSRSHALPINLRPRRYKLFRFLLHPNSQRRLLIDLFLRGVFAHVL